MPRRPSPSLSSIRGSIHTIQTSALDEVGCLAPSRLAPATPEQVARSRFHLREPCRRLRRRHLSRCRHALHWSNHLASSLDKKSHKDPAGRTFHTSFDEWGGSGHCHCALSSPSLSHYMVCWWGRLTCPDLPAAIALRQSWCQPKVLYHLDHSTLTCKIEKAQISVALSLAGTHSWGDKAFLSHCEQ